MVRFYQENRMRTINLEGYSMDDFNDFLGFMVTNSGGSSGSSGGDGAGCLSWVITVGFFLLIIGILLG